MPQPTEELLRRRLLDVLRREQNRRWETLLNLRPKTVDRSYRDGRVSTVTALLPWTGGKVQTGEDGAT